jgi:hypothetical protein
MARVCHKGAAAGCPDSLAPRPISFVNSDSPAAAFAEYPSFKSLNGDPSAPATVIICFNLPVWKERCYRPVESAKGDHFPESYNPAQKA